MARQQPPNGVSLKEYIERIFEEREKALNLAFKAQQEALAIATISLNRELEHLNKLRQEVLRDRADFVTRPEMKLISDRLEGVAARQSGGRELIVQFRQMVGDVDKLKETMVSREAISLYNRWLVGLTVVLLAAIIGVVTNTALRLHG